MSFLFRQKARAVFPLVAVLLGLGGCAYMTPGQPEPPPLPALAKPAPFTAADAAFVQKLNAMDLTQTALANSAKTHAGRSDLALLAATIAKDLTDVQAQLAKLAAAHTLTLTGQPTAVDQKQITRMQHMQGAVFDKRYIRAFTTAHARIKPVLASQIAHSKDPEVVKIARDVQTRLATYQAAMK